jgi:hypothetical protein
MIRLTKILALVFFLVGTIPTLAVQASPDSFVIVRSAKNPTTRLSFSQLKDMLIGRRKVWPHGAVVLVAIGPPGSAELNWLSESLLHVTESMLMTKIRQEVFKGEMRRPIVTASAQETIAALVGNAGALGVLRAKAAAAAAGQVAVVQIY